MARVLGGTAPWTLAALLAALGGCGGGDEAEPAPPHIIMLSLDTLRADRLGCYGCETAKTPHLDALAARASLFASCTATAPWTLPSHASMFTGLLPLEHGTHGFKVDGMVDNVHPLHDEHRTLAEELGIVGYETAGFVANTVYLAVRYGIAQGFGTYEVKRQPAAQVTDRVLRHLDGITDESSPQFVFVNYMDMHRPYGAYTYEETLRMPPEETPDKLLEALCIQVMNDGDAPGELGERVLSLYDLALTRLDAEVGRLIQGLKDRGLYDGCVIVVTSDHGEAFGTHEIVEHGKDVFEPLVAVPLIVKGPSQASGIVHDRHQASLVDVPGIVAKAVGGAAGEELERSFPRTPGTHAVVTEVHFARPRDIVLYTDRFQHERTAWRDGSFKLIVGGDEPELYNLKADPGELKNLATSESARMTTMLRALERFTKENAYQGERLMPTAPTEAQRREAAAIGYGAPLDTDERPK